MSLHRNKVLRSKAPLKRKTRLSPKRAKPRRSGRVRDRDYLVAVRALPCCLRILQNCLGPVQAHHAGQHPMGRKADDSTAIPLCAGHHDGLHGRRVVLRWCDPSGAVTEEAARPWQDRMIFETRARLGWLEAA